MNWRRSKRSAQKPKQKRYDCISSTSRSKLTTIQEAERAAEEEEQREIDIARGNPLLNSNDFTIKRRWDDDVVFKNQARGTEDRNKKKEFINDMLRSDFHKKFMVSKYNSMCTWHKLIYTIVQVCAVRSMALDISTICISGVGGTLAFCMIESSRGFCELAWDTPDLTSDATRLLSRSAEPLPF